MTNDKKAKRFLYQYEINLDHGYRFKDEILLSLLSNDIWACIKKVYFTTLKQWLDTEVEMSRLLCLKMLTEGRISNNLITYVVSKKIFC